jgi:hypothetical protein
MSVDHGKQALLTYYNSVSYRGGPYFVPSRVDSEGNVWYDLREMTASQWAQYRMRTHFDSLDADSE